MVNAWVEHVMAFKAANPDIPYGECMSLAKASYTPSDTSMVLYAGAKKKKKKSGGKKKRTKKSKSPKKKKSGKNKSGKKKSKKSSRK